MKAIESIFLGRGIKKMKTVIVSPDIVGPIKNGGIGTFVTNFARLLCENQYPVSIIFTGRAELVRSKWESIYEQLGIDVIEIDQKPCAPNAIGDFWFRRRGESAMHAIPSDADIIYLQDWQANGFLSLQHRRYQPSHYPIFINVLHSSSAWLREGMQQFPQGHEDLCIDFAERYVAQHSDFIVAPSRHMHKWVLQHSWKLPSKNHVAVLGYPFFPHKGVDQEERIEHSDRFKRIIFLGRLETRKGFELFIETLQFLKQHNAELLDSLDEIVFMGKKGNNSYKSFNHAFRLVKKQTGLRVTHQFNLDTYGVQQYLKAHRGDALIVIPSLLDNLPFAVIEASLMPGLNFICSNEGGMPEILGKKGKDQLFTPSVLSFAQTLAKCLTNGPKSVENLGRYPWEKKNQEWLVFHEKICRHAESIKARRQTLNLCAAASIKLDICIFYSNHHIYLEQVLASLEKQGAQDFNLFVINDAADNQKSIDCFENMKAFYHDKAWQFVSNIENKGAGESFNSAATLGNSSYLLFLGADNIPATNMIPRLLDCIQASGDDCLSCFQCAYKDGQIPTQLSSEDLKEHADKNGVLAFLPIGNCPEAALFDNFMGNSNFIIKREVFEALGGFPLIEKKYCLTNDVGLGFLLKLSFQGYKFDIIPEFLCCYRALKAGVYDITRINKKIRRVLHEYEKQLDNAGLLHLTPLLGSLNIKSPSRLMPYSAISVLDILKKNHPKLSRFINMLGKNK